MGLDAYVRCRCWQDGRVVPPAELGALIVDDGEGLALGVPWEGNEELHDRFEDWLGGACPHERMEACNEQLSNWGGYREFQQALADRGWSHFPTLKTYLPEVNGGELPAGAAAAALAELEYFVTEAPEVPVTELLDADRDEVAYRYIPAYDGKFALGPTYTLGVDGDGFFLRDRNGDGTECEVFRSTAFTQEVRSAEVRFTDAGGHSVRRRVPPVRAYPAGESGEVAYAPERLVVRTRLAGAEEYAYIVTPLRRLLEAALETGNPVIWC